MISYEIVDDGEIVLVHKTINAKTETYEVAKPFRVDILGSNKLVIRDLLEQTIEILRSEVTSPVSTDIQDLETILVAYNNTVPSGGSSRVIASLENVNLKDVAANVLDWASGKTAANTVNPIAVVEWVSGTSLLSIEITNEGLNGDTITNAGLGITITQDGLKSASDLATEYVTAFNATLGASYLVDDGSFIKSNPSLTPFDLAAPPTNANFQILASGDIALSKSALYDGKLTFNSVNTYTSLFGFDGTVFLLVDKILSYSNTTGALNLDGLGDWAYPILVGTENDFIVNIYIYGDTI